MSQETLQRNTPHGCRWRGRPPSRRAACYAAAVPRWRCLVAQASAGAGAAQSETTFLNTHPTQVGYHVSQSEKKEQNTPLGPLQNDTSQSTQSESTSDH